MGAGALRRALRWAGWLALAAGALVALAVTGLLGTQPGRDLLTRQVLPRVNDALPGRIELDELARLSPWGASLRGLRVYDPGGDLVLQVAAASAALEPWPLLSSEVHVRHLSLTGAQVDLVPRARPDRGLLAAFIDPSAPDVPEEDAGPAPSIRLPRIHVRDLTIRTQVEPLGALQLHVRVLAAAFRSAEQMEASLRELRAELRDAQGPWATLEHARGRYRPAARSRLQARLTLADTPIHLAASGVIPEDLRRQDGPVSARVQVRALGPATLARLGLAAASDLLRAPLDLDLTVGGRLRALRSRLRLTSAGGQVVLRTQLRALETLRLELRSDGLDLTQLLRDVDLEPLRFALTARANLKDPTSIPFSFVLADGALGAQRLPTLTASGRSTPSGVADLRLNARGYGARLDAQGELGFDGSGALALQARVPSLPGGRGALRVQADVKASPSRRIEADLRAQGRDFAIYGTSAARLKLALRCEGALPFPQVSLDLSARDVQSSDLRVSELTASLRGGPRAYTASMRARLPEAALQLDARATRDLQGLTLAIDARAAAKGQRLSLQLPRARFDYTGRVRVPSARLRSAGQSLALSGSYDPRAARLKLDLSGTSLDLSALSSALALPRAWHGHVDLALHADGAVSSPKLDLDLRARAVRLAEAPALDAALGLSLDPRAGTAELTLRALTPVSPFLGTETAAFPPLRGFRPRSDLRSNLRARSRTDEKSTVPALQEGRNGGQRAAGLDLQHDLRGRFKPGRARLIARLLAGEYRAETKLVRLDSAFVAGWMQQRLPVSGALSAHVLVEGTPHAPSLTAQARGELHGDIPAQSQRLDLRLRYQDAHAELVLASDDSKGRFLDLALSADLPQARGRSDALDRLLALGPRLGDAAAYDLELSMLPRPLASFPIPGLDPALAQAQLELSARLQHRPQQEPDVSLRGHLDLPALGKTEACAAQPLGVDVSAELRGGRVDAAVRALRDQQLAAQARVTAALPLIPLLAGGSKVSVADVSSALTLQEVDLATLPFVCGLARGRLSAEGEVHDLLGAKPTAELRARAHKLRLGGSRGIDAEVQGSLSSSQIALGASLREHGASDASSLRLRIPVAFAQGKLSVAGDAALDGELVLRKLPLAPFSSRVLAIGYADGWLDGRVQLGGTLAAPAPRGALSLDEGRLTLNALAQPLRDIRARLRFHPQKLELVALRARDLDGTLRMRGTLDLPSSQPTRLKLHADLDDFPVRQNGVAVAELGMKADLDATITPEHTDAKLVLSDIVTWLFDTSGRSAMPLAPHPDIVRESESEPEAAPPTTADQSPRSVELSLDATDSFWVKRADFAIKLSTQLDIRVAGDKVAVRGDIHLNRGYLELMGSVFDVERGSRISFIGGDPPDPVLKVAALYKSRRSGDLVRVSITGRASAPVIAFFLNDSEVSAGDAMMAIYGKSQSGRSSASAEDQARSVMAGVIASVVGVTARRELGAAAPMLMIDPNDKGTGGRVRAGFELDAIIPESLRQVVRGLYVEGIVSHGEEETASSGASGAGVLIEVYLPRDLVTAGSYGPGTTWSLDLGWEP